MASVDTSWPALIASVVRPVEVVNAFANECVNPLDSPGSITLNCPQLFFRSRVGTEEVLISGLLSWR